MFSIGDRVVLELWTEESENFDEPGQIVGTIVSTFYESGDPVQAVSVRADDGRIFGSMCSSWCRPL